jgi:hypothetical protein
MTFGAINGGTMAIIGLPGGAEWWIIFVVLLLLLGPVALVGFVVWLVARRKPKDVTPTPTSPAGWLADPSGRHELRYWNGSSWAAQVSDRGKQSEDPA